MRPHFYLGAALIALLAADASAQGIANRVAAVRTGTVHFSFASRSGVCGNGANSISFGSSRMTWGDRDANGEWEADDCEPGPVRVSLRVADGTVTRIRTYVGGRWRAPAAGATAPVDLGMISVKDASEYLLGLAERDSGRAAKDAILPSVLADSVIVWPRLLSIAKNERRPRDVRKQSVFWLGQAAGEAATAGLDSLIYAGDVDREVREQAVFALSQRPRDEGVPALIRVVRTNRDPMIKKRALFWLGQTNDPRAIALFEEILMKQ